MLRIVLKETAVGTKCKDSSFDSFANVFKAYIETTTLSKTILRTTVCGNPTYKIPFPYGTCGNQTLKPSLNNNLHHPTIKFMAETFDSETAFLDTAVFKGTRVKEKSILDAKTHFKQIETFLHTHFTSCHPPSFKKEKPWESYQKTPQKQPLRKIIQN